MVAGELGSMIPCFNARPERGRTWHSTSCGSSISSPVWTSRRSPGRSTKSGSQLATSKPADPGVARAGSGRSGLLGSRRKRTNIRGQGTGDRGQGTGDRGQQKDRDACVHRNRGGGGSCDAAETERGQACAEALAVPCPL